MSDAARTFLAAEIALLSRVVAEPLPPFDWGTDWACWDDLDPSGDMTAAPLQSLAQDLYHRLTTERNAIPDDKDFGRDLAGKLSKGLTQQQLFQIGSESQSELLKDDRVLEAVVGVSWDGSTLQVRASITPKDLSLQPFSLIFAVGSDGAAVFQALQQGLS